MTTIICGGEEQVLISHWMNKGFLDALIWGDAVKEQPFEEWLTSKTEEEKQAMLEKGFHPNVIAATCGGTIKLFD